MNCKTFFIIFSFLFLAVFLCIIPGFTSTTGTLNPEENVYYVAKGGNDQNPGTLDSPWLTIQHAAENLAAGDTVHIREGTYHESVYIRQGGSEGNPITFSAYPDEVPIIDGTGVTESKSP